MAIEIRELRIKVNIVDATNESFYSNQKINAVKIKELKAAIIKECTSKVFEKIKEKTER